MKTQPLGIVLSVGAVLLLTTELGSAHHGIAGFDPSRTITVTGTITRVEIVNPHSVVYIDVRNDKGIVENWALSGGGLNNLVRAGVKEMLQPGTVMTAVGWAPRNDPRYDLQSKLAYSEGALAKLRNAHLLQVGEIRFAHGPEHSFGMGPRFSGTASK
jgi:hypothetical protein